MRLMTFGINENGVRGLINITEANKFAQQEILYTIPVENEIAKNFSTLDEIEYFLSNNKFECNVIIDLRPSKIYLTFDKSKGVLKTFFKSEIILFEIEEELNICTHKNSIRFKHNKIIKLIKYLIAKFAFKFYQYPNNKKTCLKNIYVGTESSEEYKNHSFIILTLKSSHLLEKLYIKHRAFITN